MKIMLEIHPAEGGDDAKLLVHTQATIYQRFAARVGATARVERRGFI